MADSERNGQAISADAVNHPVHYTFSAHEPIDVIEAWALPYHLGNVVKYLARAGRKGSRLEDLKKARWYLDRYIARQEARAAEAPVQIAAHPDITGPWVISRPQDEYL